MEPGPTPQPSVQTPSAVTEAAKLEEEAGDAFDKLVSTTQKLVLAIAAVYAQRGASFVLIGLGTIDEDLSNATFTWTTWAGRISTLMSLALVPGQHFTASLRDKYRADAGKEITKVRQLIDKGLQELGNVLQEDNYRPHLVEIVVLKTKLNRWKKEVDSFEEKFGRMGVLSLGQQRKYRVTSEEVDRKLAEAGGLRIWE